MKGSVRSENSEMLEFDDPLEGFAMSTRTRGLQNEVKQQQKHEKTREETRNEKKGKIQVKKVAFWRLWGRLGTPKWGPQGLRHRSAEHQLP